ncbi:MAG: hypothetical protein WA110_07040 [Anaerolineaceae bacterium]
MKIKKSVVVGLSVFVMIILGAFVYSRTSAQGTSIFSWLVPSGQDDNAPIQEVVAAQSNLSFSDPTQSSQDGKVASLGSIQNEIQHVVDINAKASQEFLVPGYLHIAKTKEAPLTSSETFADGTLIPQIEKINEWYLLGNNGEVMEYVSITDTGDPKTSQVVIYKNKLFNNLTFPNLKSQAPEDFYLQALDFGFSTYYQGKQNVLNSIVETTAESISVVSKTSFDQPINYKDELSVSAIKDVYTFATDTGMVRTIKNYLIQPDGNEIMQARTEIVSVDSIDGFPDDVAAYLGQGG